MRKTLYALLVPTLAFSTLAFAGDPMPAEQQATEQATPADPVAPVEPGQSTELKPTFASLDKDLDGKIAKAEIPVEHELTTLFVNFDSDKDQYLSRIEFDEYASEEEEEAE